MVWRWRVTRGAATDLPLQPHGFEISETKTKQLVFLTVSKPEHERDCDSSGISAVVKWAEGFRLSKFLSLQSPPPATTTPHWGKHLQVRDKAHSSPQSRTRCLSSQNVKLFLQRRWCYSHNANSATALRGVWWGVHVLQKCSTGYIFTTNTELFDSRRTDTSWLQSSDHIR